MLTLAGTEPTVDGTSDTYCHRQHDRNNYLAAFRFLPLCGAADVSSRSCLDFSGHQRQRSRIVITHRHLFFTTDTKFLLIPTDIFICESNDKRSS